MQEFKPAFRAKWYAYGLLGGMFAIFLLNVWVVATPAAGPLAMRIVFVTFWGLMLWLTTIYANGVLAIIWVGKDRVERKSWFGSRRIRWSRLESARRLDKGDSRILFQGDGTRFDITWTGYERSDRLLNALFQHLKEGVLQSRFRWRTMQQPVVFIFGSLLSLISIVAGVCFIVGSRDNTSKYFGLCIGAFMVVAGISLPMFVLGINEISEKGIRADPFWGIRRELYFH